MLLRDLCKESKSLKLPVEWLRYKNSFYKDHPDYFEADGLTIFVGAQGSGKTLSAVNYVYRLMESFPKCMLVTNLGLRDYPLDGQRVFPFCNNDDFARYSNGEQGVIFLVDEIQLYLNSLESRNINLDVVAQISQQRKQRKHIVATSQVFGRMAKPLREQFDSVLLCRNYLGFLQCNQLIDRTSISTDNSADCNVSGDVVEKFYWFHSPDMYGRYDTSLVIERGKFTAGENQLKGVFDDGRLDALDASISSNH